MTRKIASLLLLSVLLVACGQDKPTQAETTSTKPATETTQNTETTTEATNTAEAVPEAVQETETAAEETAETTTAATAEATAPDASFEQVIKAAAELPTDAGQKRYEATCKVCHEPGMLDAPKLSDKENWQKRLSKGEETLFLHSAKGFNKMPAQAVGDVSEAEVYAAMQYMLQQAQ